MKTHHLLLCHAQNISLTLLFAYHLLVTVSLMVRSVWFLCGPVCHAVQSVWLLWSMRSVQFVWLVRYVQSVRSVQSVQAARTVRVVRAVRVFGLWN